MKLITETQRQKLLANGRKQRAAIDSGTEPLDFAPVVKFFAPDANATWLLTELEPGDPGIAFGLCDLGMGCPELGYVSLTELAAVRGPLGLHVERDLHFNADKSISAYAEAARTAGRVTT